MKLEGRYNSQGHKDKHCELCVKKLITEESRISSAGICGNYCEKKKNSSSLLLSFLEHDFYLYRVEEYIAA